MKLTIILSVLVSLWTLNPSYAKPMLSPTDTDAAGANFIVVAVYLGHAPVSKGDQSDNQNLYFAGVDAQYKVESVLKKSNDPIVSKLSLNRTIRVNYAFHDGSACLAPPDFKLDLSKTQSASGKATVGSRAYLPEVNSRWILFLNPTGSFNQFSTYRGDYGRWPVTAENMKKVQSLLQSSSKRKAAK